MQEAPAVGVPQQRLRNVAPAQPAELDGAPVVDGEDIGGPHLAGGVAETLRRHQILVEPRPHLRPSSRALPKAERLHRVRPQAQARRRGQHLGAAIGTGGDAGHVVGEHRVAAREQGREQRGLARSGVAEEQHRARPGVDGARVQGEHPALLQAGAQHRADQEDRHLMVVPAGRLDEDVGSPGDLIAAHPLHMQAEDARSRLPERVPVGERSRHRAEADRHVRHAVRACGQPGDGEFGGDAQSVGRVSVGRGSSTRGRRRRPPSLGLPRAGGGPFRTRVHPPLPSSGFAPGRLDRPGRRRLPRRARDNGFAHPRNTPSMALPDTVRP